MSVVDISALRGKDNELIVKELSVAGCIGSNRTYTQTYTFAPPYPEQHLPYKSRKTNNWVTASKHGISWNDGLTPHWKVKTILRTHAQFCSTVRTAKYALMYAKGGEKAKFLSEILGYPVIDLDTLGCPKAEDIYLDEYTSCTLPHHMFDDTHCSVSKSHKFLAWLKKNRYL